MNDKYARVLYTHTYECLVYSSIGRLANSRSTSVKASEEGFIVSVFHDLWAVSREKLWQIYRPDKMLIDPSIKYYGIISLQFSRSKWNEKFSYLPRYYSSDFLLIYNKIPSIFKPRARITRIKNSYSRTRPTRTDILLSSFSDHEPAACFAYAARHHHCAFDRVAPVTSRPIDLPWGHSASQWFVRGCTLFLDWDHGFWRSFEMERSEKQRERERETTLTARLDAGKSPLFFLEPRRLSLSLEERRGEASH